MDNKNFIKNHLEKSIEVKQKIVEHLIPEIERVANILIQQLKHGNKILLCGNGGSAADAQHIAAELVVRLKSSNNRPAIPALALTVDTSILTAGANDFGFEYVFARQVEALGNKGDVLIGISTSGNSKNVMVAVEEAQRNGLITVGLLGSSGGKLKNMVDTALIVPSDVTAHIQEAHITIGHILCDLIEQYLF